MFLKGFHSSLRSIKASNYLKAASCQFSSTTQGIYGINPIPFTNKIEIFDKSKYPQIPVYRLLDHFGEIKGEINVSDDLALKLYKTMLKVRIMDDFLLKCQRQGSISFYMSSIGEESVVGTAAAVNDKDVIFSQYREQGTLLYRGFSYQDFVDQCCGLYRDAGKGRQMPIHYTSKKHNFVTISSPLATQIPQAAGYAFHQKVTNSENITLCYFGDGSSSEGDFHSGLNIASTLNAPVLYIVRNNGFAISTYIGQQSLSDGIADKALGYNMPTLRVDGNDVLAVYQATKIAREEVFNKKRPFLLELLSNRLGDHSTSDDSSAYRSKETLKEQFKFDGMIRMKKYLVNKKLWNDKMEEEINKKDFEELKKCLSNALNAEPTPPESLYDDVYSELTDHLKDRKQELLEHIKRNTDFYGKQMH